MGFPAASRRAGSPIPGPHPSSPLAQQDLQAADTDILRG